jgi:hypothetical protein
MVIIIFIQPLYTIHAKAAYLYTINAIHYVRAPTNNIIIILTGLSGYYYY